VLLELKIRAVTRAARRQAAAHRSSVRHKTNDPMNAVTRPSHAAVRDIRRSPPLLLSLVFLQQRDGVLLSHELPIRHRMLFTRNIYHHIPGPARPHLVANHISMPAL
jgi:hypothetical protein